MVTRPRRVRSATPVPPSAAPASGAGPVLIAGYRVLRRLGSGDRADLYVGVAPSRSGAAGREASGQEPGVPPTPVVLKVFHPGTEDLSVEREVRALTGLTPGRLPTLFDIGTVPDGRTCLVLEQLTGGTLSGFLAVRQHIRPGEAVTILAPVAAALGELQAIGLTHPTVNLSTILFDAGGRPVLTGLGALRAVPEAGRGRSEALEAAHGGLARVVRAVLDQVDPGLPAVTALRDLERWCAAPAARSTTPAPGELERLLFAWAEAAPVPLGQTREAGTGTRAVGEWLRRPLPDDPAGRKSREAVQVTTRESRPGRTLGRLVSRRGTLPLAALVVVVVGLAVTAPGPGRFAATPGARSAASPAPAGASGQKTAGPEGPTAAGVESDAVSGDDPAVAVPALLRLRARCLGAVSVVCLDGVHQARSAALAADSHTLRLIQQGGAAPDEEDLSSWAAMLADRTGDVAIVSLQAPDAQRQPASVLVVKGEAGWRIRDIFDY